MPDVSGLMALTYISPWQRTKAKEIRIQTELDKSHLVWQIDHSLIGLGILLHIIPSQTVDSSLVWPSFYPLPEAFSKHI